MLDGYARTMLAGAMASVDASWAALMVLSTACLRSGAPTAWISDSGGAYISNAFEAVCDRLGLDHKTIVRSEGQSSLHFMETHFNIQRRLYDSQFSLSQPPAELEQMHQMFLKTYNTTAHQGLLQDGFPRPIALEVLGEAKGRLYSQAELARKFSRALFPRMTNRDGCVTLHRYPFYVEQGLPQTQVLRWVYGEQLRATLDNVGLAAYHWRYDWQSGKVKDSQEGRFSSTPFASSQGSLVPWNPQESLVLYRPKPRRRPARVPSPAQPLWLFALVHIA